MDAEEIRRIAFEAVGEASLCWEPRPTGVFDDKLATVAGERLAVAIAAAIRDAEREATDPVYTERNTLVALVARMALALGWRAGLRSHQPDPDPTWDDDWKNVVAIDLPTGQVTWHYRYTERNLFAGLPQYPVDYDGHSTPEKYERVRRALAEQKPEESNADG